MNYRVVLHGWRNNKSFFCCWRFGLFPSGGSQWLLFTIPAVFPGDTLPSHHGPGIPSRQEGRGMQSFLPNPGGPLMSWEVGRQLLALTSTGCTRLASTLDHSVEPIWAPPGHQEPGQGLLEAPRSSLPSHFIPLFCRAPLPRPQPFHQGMNELGRGLWPVTNYFQKSLVTRQVGLRQTPALLSPSCRSQFRKHNFEGEARWP